MVDEHFVINPVKEGGREKDWSDPTILPTSMTALGAYLVISGQRVFEKTTSTTNKKDSRPSAVYFSFAVSSDIPPDEIVARISVDWSMLGGTRLSVKTLCFFDTCTPIAIYFLWNEAQPATLLEELKVILNSVSPLEPGGLSQQLPPMTLRKQIPRIPGQATENFKHLSQQAQMARRAWHIEVEARHAQSLIDLVARIKKETNMISEMWGRQVHFTKVADFSTTAGELKDYVKFAQRHVNFHCSMTCISVKGISYLDAATQIICTVSGKPKGTLTLRQALLKYVKMSDGSTLIAEIHQSGPMGTVEVIVPNTAEAETMVLMMNRQLPAYLFHILQENEMDVPFIKALLKESCCPVLVGGINRCQWNEKERVISTPEQLEDDKRLAAIEKAAWYRDEFGKHMVDGMKKVKQYTDPEALYNLDGERSVKTLNTRNDPKALLIDEEEDDDEDDETYSDQGSEGEESSFDIDDMSSIGTLGSLIGNQKDVTMDSASVSVDGGPSSVVETDKVTAVTRVHWPTTSSADASAPSPMAGGG